MKWKRQKRQALDLPQKSEAEWGFELDSGNVVEDADSTLAASPFGLELFEHRK
jgi:hypothetical protein